MYVPDAPSSSKSLPYLPCDLCSLGCIDTFKVTGKYPRYRLRNELRPTDVAGGFQPNHPRTTFLANISPKPSMTPLTKGRKRFIARDANNAFTRVPVDKVESKTAIVGATGAGCECEALCSGEEWPSLLPGNDTEGNEDVTSEGRSSHF
jgi:hypothetical protein